MERRTSGRPGAQEERPAAGCGRPPGRRGAGEGSSGSYGVYTAGRGAVGMALPMKKLGCGGWL